mgnify:FL=1
MRNTFVVIVLLILCTKCNKPNQSNPPELVEQELSGLELSRQYCQSCHQYPSPELLNRTTWQKYVLPRMGYMLGIYENDSTRKTLLESGLAGELVKGASIFPTNPLIEEAHWTKIKEYYLNNAPKQLSVEKKDYQPLNQFEIVIPNYKLSPPSTTLTTFSNDGEFYIGDANSRSILHFNSNLNLIKAGKVPEGAVSLAETEKSIFITAMGSFSPTDAPSGSLISFPKTAGRPKILVDSLQRPVHSTFYDLDKDGLQDVVISEFGKWTGSLSWWKNKGNDTYEERILENRAGAIRSEVKDIDGDGYADIVALFGQGDEGIKAYCGQEDGTYKSEWLVRLPSTYGSCYFQLYDFNSDGFDDIIYAAGDNGDYPPLMKPYHGIRIFTHSDDGFKESYFYALNGCYKAIPHDFDQDGDLDIAAISFFPDFENSPEEGFIFLENKGDMYFEAQAFSKISNLGRWLVMDAKDWDSDGDTDLILGSLTFEVVPEMGYVNQWIKNAVPFIILENKLYHTKD